MSTASTSPSPNSTTSSAQQKKSVYVANVASLVTPDILQQFFANVGPVMGMKTLGLVFS